MMKHKKIILAAYMILMIAAAIILTLVTEKLEGQFRLRWDLTDSQVFSIGETTKAVLQKVDRDITVYTLYRTGSEERTVSELLRRYQQENSRIKIVNIDPAEKPLFTQQFETDGVRIEQSSLIIREDGNDNFRVINAQDLYEWQLQEEQLYATGMAAEQRITAAIASIQGGAQITAYFVTGHGELNMSESYYLSQTLQNDGYKVAEYDLIYNDTALGPKSCLLFLAPLRDLSDEEYQVVYDYMNAGGKAAFWINPRAGEMSNFGRLFAAYGLELKDDLIVETDSNHYLNSQNMIIPQQNKENQVLRSIVGADATLILPNCRSIAVTEKKDVALDTIVSSSNSSYGKINPYTETLDKESGDLDGPFRLAVTARHTQNHSRLILQGNSDFVATLNNTKAGGNIALFMDSVAWISEKADSIVIQPKSLVSAPLQITNAATGYRLTVLVIIIIPAMILGAGTFIWRRRLSR